MTSEISRRIKAARQDGAESLDLSGMGLTALPAEIGALKTLKWLASHTDLLSEDWLIVD
jgi:hypothetical protein